MLIESTAYGRKLTVYNDNKRLAAVLKRPIGENPIRLQRMLCQIMGYDLDFKYIKGKDLLIAYALSTSYTTNHTHSQNKDEIETIGLVIQDRSVISHLKENAEETAKENVLQSVIHHISETGPSVKDVFQWTFIQSGVAKINYHSMMTSSIELIAL